MNSRFHVLDAMRGVCAISVIFFHSNKDLLPVAHAAVDFFFLLSGFVLAKRHGAELTAGVGRRQFAIRRLTRLYPLYFIGSLMGVIPLYFLTAMGAVGFGFKGYLLSLLFFPFFIPLPTTSWLGTFPLNPPAWSLFSELIANGAFLALGWRVRRLLVILIVSAPLLLLAISRFNGEQFFADPFAYNGFFGSFPRAFFSFFLGVLLWRVWPAPIEWSGLSLMHCGPVGRI